ncbi:MAG: hypothetical protein HC880_08785 [Bacteroidia bacterium]|nr:hypothetical protein [Bacteroidia bacterium]
MNAAIKKGNTELAAQSCYMAAKCEQKQYYLDPLTKSSWEGIMPSYTPEHRRYFSRLAQEFDQTQYYQKALAECKYFHEFVKH